ncbi:MAG: DUF1698 domain-containing protein [Sedimentisphaeraceae bacterium JB056]
MKSLFKKAEIQKKLIKGLPQYNITSTQNIDKAKENYISNFNIETSNYTLKDIKLRAQQYFWHYPFSFGEDLYIESDSDKSQGIYGRHYKRYMHIFSNLLDIYGGSLENKNILDCACNCGFWSLQALANGAKSVTSFDASEKNIEQADFLKEITNTQNVTYQKLDVADISKNKLGKFDITFFLGILYHLNNPVEILSKLKEVTKDTLIVDTNVCIDSKNVLELRIDDVHKQNHSNNICYYPSPSAVFKMLEIAGFRDVKILNSKTEMPEIYNSGRRYTFIASS